MLGVPGIAARAFGAVARTGTSVPMISQSSSEQSICFVVPAAVGRTRVLDELRQAFERELAGATSRASLPRTTWWWSPSSGRAIRNTPGIAGRVFTAVGDGEINVLAIAMGSSECSISLIVDGPRARDAVAHPTIAGGLDRPSRQGPDAGACPAHRRRDTPVLHWALLLRGHPTRVSAPSHPVEPCADPSAPFGRHAHRPAAGRRAHAP